jgi:hypothetical protein
MNDVLKELIRRQRKIAREKGHRLPGDEELAAALLDRYGQCPTCREPLEFEPRVVVELAESGEHFIFLYGCAIQRHHRNHPACEAKLYEEHSTPESRRRILREIREYEKDYDRWLGLRPPQGGE